MIPSSVPIKSGRTSVTNSSVRIIDTANKQMIQNAFCSSRWQLMASIPLRVISSNTKIS